MADGFRDRWSRLAKQHDEWHVGRKYFSIESLAPVLPTEPAALPAAAD